MPVGGVWGEKGGATVLENFEMMWGLSYVFC